MWIFERSFIVTFCKKLELVKHQYGLVNLYLVFYLWNFSSSYFNHCPAFILEFWYAIDTISDNNFRSLAYLKRDVLMAIMLEKYPRRKFASWSEVKLSLGRLISVKLYAIGIAKQLSNMLFLANLVVELIDGICGKFLPTLTQV